MAFAVVVEQGIDKGSDAAAELRQPDLTSTQRSPYSIEVDLARWIA